MYHEWAAVSHIPATCIANGMLREECVLCGEEKESVLENEEHANCAWVTVREAGCLNGGLRQYVCADCGTILKKSEVAEVPHNWGVWETVREPTVILEGEQRRCCSVCGTEDAHRLLPVLEPTVSVNRTEAVLLSKTKTAPFIIGGLAEGDQIVSWTSSDNKVASVSETGMIKAKKPGCALITVQLLSGGSAAMKVTIKKIKMIIGLKKTYYIKKGRTRKLTVRSGPHADFLPTVFRSSNSGILSVNDEGMLLAKKKGKAVVTVVLAGKKKKAVIFVR